MTRFDFQQQPQPPANDPLARALEDVAIPEGLESRLLASVLGNASEYGSTALVAAAEIDQEKPNRWSRRRWLAAGLAAGVSGVMALRGYQWTRRELTQAEVVEAVNRSLAKEDWGIRGWSELSTKQVAGISVPAGLRPSGWQYRKTSLSRRTVAYKLTRPGGPTAVLFACKTSRDTSGFPAAPPLVPQCMQSGEWTHIAIWRTAPGILYAVAVYEGFADDYDRLFPAGAAVPFA